MEFRVLGRLLVRADDRELSLGGPLRRAVPAALLLEPDRMVPTDRLLGVMYGEQPPPTALEHVRQAVYHLRRALPTAAGGHRIVTGKPGYRLRLAPDDVVDLDQFDPGVARACRARAGGDLDTAARELRGPAPRTRIPVLPRVPRRSPRPARAVQPETGRTARPTTITAAAWPTSEPGRRPTAILARRRGAKCGLESVA